jgi:hypothetical protein
MKHIRIKNEYTCHSVTPIGKKGARNDVLVDMVN